MGSEDMCMSDFREVEFVDFQIMSIKCGEVPSLDNPHCVSSFSTELSTKSPWQKQILLFCFFPPKTYAVTKPSHYMT